MAQGTQPIPNGLRSVTPQLVVADGHVFIDFLTKAFGAESMHMMPGAGGKGIMHGAVRIGDCVVFVSDQAGFAKPTTANLFLYVPDVDATFKKAVDQGAKVVAPVMDMFWGDRWGLVEDPFGNHWQLATHTEDVAPDEMMRRMAAAQAQPQK